MITRRELITAGTGGVITIEGDDRDELLAEAKRIRDGIDFIRSPSISFFYPGVDKCGAEITYYGLD
jgi:hypothetical protein